MKSYKMFQKQYIGSSDYAALTLVGAREGIGVCAEMLRFGGDAGYYAYMVDGEAEIGAHYELIASFNHWAKVYDDDGLVLLLEGDKINFWRAGEMGCIVQILKREKEGEWEEATATLRLSDPKFFEPVEEVTIMTNQKNTKTIIRLLHGETNFPMRHLNDYEEGDSIFGVDSCPRELKRWINDEAAAREELKKYHCKKHINEFVFINEYALEITRVDEDEDFDDAMSADYVLADREA